MGEVTEVVSQTLVPVELQVELAVLLVLLDQGRQDLGSDLFFIERHT